MRYAVVALTSALVGGLSVWVLGPGDHDASPGGSHPATEDEPRRTREGRIVRDSPTALADCKQTLVRTQVELRTAQATARAAVAGQLFDDEGAPAPPPSAARAPAEGSSEGAAASARSEERERYRAASEKVREALVSELGISDSEQQSLADVVCPQRENERQLFTDFGDGAIDAATLVQAIGDERAASADGMRRSLGNARYQALRRVGAMGILAPRLCKRR